jgi:hypothetical protein
MSASLASFVTFAAELADGARDVTLRRGAFLANEFSLNGMPLRPAIWAY